jgi:mannose-6-phosphate isomerase-like protein (cupin superfamily)
MSDEYKTIWTSTSKKCDKAWGFEQHIGSLSTITAKMLHMKKGQSTSFKYYRRKNEVLFLRKGQIEVEYDSEKYHWQLEGRPLKRRVLVEGDILYVQSSCPYKITALKDSEIVEIGDCQHDAPQKIEEE